MRRAALLCLLALAACGGGDDDPSAELLERLPPESQAVASVDLEAVREAAGEGGEAEERVRFAAALGLPYLARPQATPLRDAIDLAQVRAVATNSFAAEDSLAVVDSEQSFDDLAAALEREGYAREGELLVSDARLFEVVYPVVGEADGLLLLGGSRAAVEEAAEREDGGDEELLELLAALEDAPVRGAGLLSGGCLRGVAISDQLDPPEGELVLQVRGVPSADRVRLDEDTIGPSPGLELGEIDVGGSFATVPYEYDPAPGSFALIRLLQSDVPPSRLYDC